MLGLAIAAAAYPGFARAEAPLDLGWHDLLPKDQPYVPNALRSLLPHDETAMSARQPASTGLRFDWNGKLVRLPGFVLPLDFDGARVSAFILVPFVGACVHIPPPPANQLVLVTTQTPFNSKGLYDPVNVTGRLNTASTSTELADVGYALVAQRIEPIG